jgi:hypothetical protein
MMPPIPTTRFGIHFITSMFRSMTEDAIATAIPAKIMQQIQRQITACNPMLLIKCWRYLVLTASLHFWHRYCDFSCCISELLEVARGGYLVRHRGAGRPVQRKNFILHRGKFSVRSVCKTASHPRPCLLDLTGWPIAWPPSSFSRCIAEKKKMSTKVGIKTNNISGTT